MHSARPLLLAVNGGSATIKFALFELNDRLERIDREQIDHANDPGIVREILNRAARHGTIDAIGHRIVMGGADLDEHQLLTPAVLEKLRKLQPLDPAHLPNEIALIEAFAKERAEIPQVLCFDSVFHRDLPHVAKLLPIPRKHFDAGVRRFGYHGLSFSFLREELQRVDPSASGGRIILAHLGSGCSLAAVRDGKPIDTSMAFTPAAGLMMGTRSGDLDPGVLIYLLRNEKLSAQQLDDLITRESGMKGLSQTTADVRELLALRETDARAKDAIDLFCYTAKKWIGAFTAALGGLDTLVFTGGIGENAAAIRAQICDGLKFIDLHLDAPRNQASSAIISSDSSKVRVRVIKTDEERMMAKIVRRVLAQHPS